MPTTIILIRHGQTRENAEKRYIGRTDARLDRQGRAQGRATRSRMRGMPVHRVFSSDSRRAADFARIIFRGTPVHMLGGVREINFGIFERMTHDELLKKHPALYRRWLRNTFRIPVPGAEPLVVFKQRVIAAFRQLCRRYKGKTLAVVTHAGPIRVILAAVMRKASVSRIIPAHAGITVIELDAKGKSRVILLNDTRHIHG